MPRAPRLDPEQRRFQARLDRKEASLTRQDKVGREIEEVKLRSFRLIPFGDNWYITNSKSAVGPLNRGEAELERDRLNAGRGTLLEWADQINQQRPAGQKLRIYRNAKILTEDPRLLARIAAEDRVDLARRQATTKQPLGVTIEEIRDRLAQVASTISSISTAWGVDWARNYAEPPVNPVPKRQIEVIVLDQGSYVTDGVGAIGPFTWDRVRTIRDQVQNGGWNLMTLAAEINLESPRNQPVNYYPDKSVLEESPWDRIEQADRQFDAEQGLQTWGPVDPASESRRLQAQRFGREDVFPTIPPPRPIDAQWLGWVAIPQQSFEQRAGLAPLPKPRVEVKPFEPPPLWDSEVLALLDGHEMRMEIDGIDLNLTNFYLRTYERGEEFERWATDIRGELVSCSIDFARGEFPFLKATLVVEVQGTSFGTPTTAALFEVTRVGYPKLYLRPEAIPDDVQQFRMGTPSATPEAISTGKRRFWDDE